MKGSTIYTIALLAFLAIAIGYFVFQESGKKHTNANPTNETSIPTAQTSKPASDSVSTIPAGKSNAEIIVYYFHGNKRCANCIKIENYTKEAVETGFASEMQNKSLSMQILNTDKPENEHFVKDFQLTTKSVVLVKMLNGQQLKWKNLEKVWDFLNDKAAFIKYIQDETQAFSKEE